MNKLKNLLLGGNVMGDINLSEEIETKLNNIMIELKNIMIEIEQFDLEIEGTIELNNYTVKQVLNCTFELLEEN